ncbi:hypothetical protein Y032_0368g71 [Ancylostoma ceylanicum]|uniref:Uncharacterized protein n=1 Tax=Ancylostoma ceylanicum TaxID=53326 RepID=A0A016RVT1_9BILA|nr:hypothetical protein Y032_0368g71 [Ancylostoma ceylanicum]
MKAKSIDVADEECGATRIFHGYCVILWGEPWTDGAPELCNWDLILDTESRLERAVSTMCRNPIWSDNNRCLSILFRI